MELLHNEVAQIRDNLRAALADPTFDTRSTPQLRAEIGEALAEGAGETPSDGRHQRPTDAVGGLDADPIAHAARAPRCISMPVIPSMKFPTMYCGSPTSRSG